MVIVKTRFATIESMPIHGDVWWQEAMNYTFPVPPLIPLGQSGSHRRVYPRCNACVRLIEEPGLLSIPPDKLGGTDV